MLGKWTKKHQKCLKYSYFNRNIDALCRRIELCQNLYSHVCIMNLHICIEWSAYNQFLTSTRCTWRGRYSADGVHCIYVLPYDSQVAAIHQRRGETKSEVFYLTCRRFVFCWSFVIDYLSHSVCIETVFFPASLNLFRRRRSRFSLLWLLLLLWRLYIYFTTKSCSLFFLSSASGCTRTHLRVHDRMTHTHTTFLSSLELNVLRKSLFHINIEIVYRLFHLISFYCSNTPYTKNSSIFFLSFRFCLTMCWVEFFLIGQFTVASINKL